MSKFYLWFQNNAWLKIHDIIPQGINFFTIEYKQSGRLVNALTEFFFLFLPSNLILAKPTPSRFNTNTITLRKWAKILPIRRKPIFFPSPNYSLMIRLMRRAKERKNRKRNYEYKYKQCHVTKRNRLGVYSKVMHEFLHPRKIIRNF